MMKFAGDELFKNIWSSISTCRLYSFQHQYFAIKSNRINSGSNNQHVHFNSANLSLMHFNTYILYVIIYQHIPCKTYAILMHMRPTKTPLKTLRTSQINSTTVEIIQTMTHYKTLKKYRSVLTRRRL